MAHNKRSPVTSDPEYGIDHMTVRPSNLQPAKPDEPDSVDVVNDVPNPAAVLAVPCRSDVPIVRALLEDAYDEIEHWYIRGESTPRSVSQFDVLREGSLYQELLAQLSATERTHEVSNDE